MLNSLSRPVFSLSTLLPAVAGLTLLLWPVATPAEPPPSSGPTTVTSADLAGLYVATRLNYRPLPRIERVPSTDGWEHWFKLEQALITLRPDGRFIASFKYYRQHVKPRAAVRPGPLLNESYKGKYSVKGTQITFIPDKTKQHRNVKPIVGTLASTQLTIPYIVAEGQSKHPLRLDLRKESNW